MKHLPMLLGAFTVVCAGCASGHAPGGADDDSVVDALGPELEEPDADLPEPGADAGEPEVPVTPDAGSPDAPAATGGTLLLSEVVVAPNAGEFIEIMNPTDTAVDLSAYYLSDAPEYWRLPAHMPDVDSTDAVVRFPAGAMIPAGAAVTVALDTTSNFAAYYDALPTYSIASGTMVAVAGGATPTITNAGEPIVLFRWDGQSDRVVDVDLMIVGSPSAINQLVDKSGEAQDGPDSGTATSVYASDARTIPAQSMAPGSGLSTKRVALESAAVEIQNGSNGVDGQDETSEATATTWDASFSEPTPGQPSPGMH